MGRTRCLCARCKNGHFEPIQLVEDHLQYFGIHKNYKLWIHHGEDYEIVSDDDDVDEEETQGYTTNGVSELLEDVCARANNNECPGTQDSCENIDMFDSLLKGACEPLYPNYKKFSKLEFVMRLMHIKIMNHMNNKSFQMILDLIKAALPEGETLPNTYYEAKKLLRNLGLGYTVIHACRYDCVLFWKENENLVKCPNCDEPRYKVVEEKGKKIPQKLDEKHKWFAKDSRNVRLGIASDGFIPSNDLNGKPHSIWPVIVVPYNLPPWRCMKGPFIFLTLLTPGPNSHGNDIDVYLRPLIDELKELWEIGVETFDAHSKEVFQLHAALLWTINDFPAYGNLSGWSTHGYLAYVVCNKDTHSMWLKSGRKICYMGHRRFLPQTHAWRSRGKHLFDGKAEKKPKPKDFSRDNMLLQLEVVEQQDFGKAPNTKNRKHYDFELNWTKRSIFFELPYWKINKLRHNVDVMHIEKNICDSVVGTLMDIEKKTKDTIRSRADLEILGLKKELLLTKRGNKLIKPPASYTLSVPDRKILCEWLKLVKFPDGYASNIARCVKEKDGKISGMKRHDCHVFLQRILPVALRGFLPKNISSALSELGVFFKELCSKTLRLEVLEKMEKGVAALLCKLEQIFPPAFFDIMVHLIVHLPHEAILGGPVQYRWMYPIERYLRTLKQYVRNKARLEGSIAEAYINNECLTFCSMYLHGIETRFNREDRNHNGDSGQPVKGLSVFSNNARPLGAAKNVMLDLKDTSKARFCVLNNTKELLPYIEQHMEELEKEDPRNVDMRHERYFSKWFEERVNRLREENSPTVSDEIYSLAVGPHPRVVRYSGCITNAIRFHTRDREVNLRTQNSSVVVKGEHQSNVADFYGVLTDVLELTYLYGNKVFIFICDWRNTDKRRNNIVTDSHFTSLNFFQTWYKDDPFVLADQVQKVFYLKDLKLRGKWHVVQHVIPRNVYDVSEKDVGAQPNDDEAYQQDDHFTTENIVQDNFGSASSCNEEVTNPTFNRNDVAAEEVDIDTVIADLEGSENYIEEEELEGEGSLLSEYDSEDEGIISSGDSDID
ncbi:uncharacterized protein LOC113352780 [Papaver somniferum]|uniref:uncharacterized protein LOC113352780 n=1 Tax=Papaver somniferum TaxID=3469 RepID=UPI000E6FAA6F|nr:uncharacterized protein LOC113352780 [Papaver somniferum]